MTDAILPPGPSTIPTLFGGTISGTISNTAHLWIADANGLFHTATDLKSEWQGYYNTMLNGAADTLTFVQRLEGNAEAVFENTGLSKLNATDQARDRQDVQREYDAIGAAMNQLGLDPKAKLTAAGYLGIEQTIESSPSLYELAVQGHGLNNPPLPKYNGYTNDFQHNVDNATLYIGGGLDNNERAIEAFFDDVGLSHLPFPTVEINGQMTQLNQNADNEDVLSQAVGAVDDAGAVRVFKASDFSTTPGNASSTPSLAPLIPPPVAPPGMITTLWGATISATITLNGHTWTADANGTFQTATNLATEWQGYYQTMLAGNGASLNAIQHLEGNAEAVFENTGLSKLSAAQQQTDRSDAQREFDAIYGALQASGIGLKTQLTTQSYLLLEKTLQNTPTLDELAVQGHGLNTPPSVRYRGYTNDFQNNVDPHTLFTGPGLNSGERAIADLFDDSIISHLPFPTVARNGELVQLNQNGDNENTLNQAVDALNQTWFTAVYTKSQFNVPGTTPLNGADPGPTMTTTFYGAPIPATMTAGAHVWTIGPDGKFHTTTNLQTEWQGYYQTMLTGNGASLTAIQRLEGNAEAVFENTSLKNLKAAQQQSFREDAQREFDAIAATIATLGLGGTLLTTQNYLSIGQTLQTNASLEELAMQGHGLNTPPSGKYNGYTNDFQNNSDNVTLYVGGGLDNGEKAIAAFFDDVILSHLPFPTIAQNGHLEQLNQDADAEDLLTSSTNATNDAMFRRVYVAGDFSKVATTVGPEVYVTPAMATATPPASPTAGTGQMLSLTGFVIPTTITVAGDTWIADANGLYRTNTDLTLQWYNSYRIALAGGPLTLMQHWQANAEAVFENTGLSKLSEYQQSVDRADAQREFDAVAQTMTNLGLGNAPLTVATYLEIEHALQDNAALEELAIQGHGLNSPPAAKYNGYTNDFQNNVDQHTLYIGGGPDTGERAIADLFDDSIMTHIPFPTVADDGELEQLNQNGADESTVEAAVANANAALFNRIYKASDFTVPGRMPPVAAPAGPTTITTLNGDTIAATMTVNGHVWTADANGVFQTTTNLEMEWRGYYQTMLAGHGDTLTAIQRLEGNAEAVFENTGLNKIYMGAAKEEADRVDVQRQFDAMAGAMQLDKTLYGIDPNAPLTEATYLRLENTLQSNVALEELAMQGHGIANAPSAQWNGAWAGFLAGVDWTTNYVGGGMDNGRAAVPYFFQEVLMSDVPFASVWQNGAWQQLGFNADVIGTSQQAAAALNDMMYRRVLVASDFSTNATATGATVLIPHAAAAGAAAIGTVVAPTGSIVTLDGSVISNTMIANGHTWTAGADGLFHTTTNLATEWQGYYQQMLAGFGGSLTAIQRMEGNAEAVFESAGLTSLSAAQQKIDREDVQRQIDAMACAIKIDSTTLGINPQAVFVQGSYLAVERTLHNNAALEELSVQGHGLTNPTSARYRGYTNDFANASAVKYVGGGLDNGTYATGAFFADNILGMTPFATVWRNGKLYQLNQNGAVEMPLATAIAAANNTGWYRTFKATDFHK